MRALFLPAVGKILRPYLLLREKAPFAKELSAQLTEDSPSDGRKTTGESPGPGGATPFAKGKNPRPAGQPLFLLKQKQEPPAGRMAPVSSFHLREDVQVLHKIPTPE